MFLLCGAVAGLLAGELRTHFRGEKREHQLATAVRHRLLAVLDAVDEAIVFRDRHGTARVINQRAGELFDLEPDAFLGEPVVELLRTVARLTEEPEDFMETFQLLRDDPEAELRLAIDQILPRRRKLRLYSAPAFDDVGALVGRIDVFTDVTDAAARADEVEKLYETARKTAESYQRALLPDKVPTLPRVSLVANYVAAAGRRAVCGDFYDFVALRDGRMAIVLGDVCGIGPVAANDAESLFAQAPPPKRVEIVPADDHGTDLLTGSQAEARNQINVGVSSGASRVSAIVAGTTRTGRIE